MMPLITLGPLRLSSYGICIVLALGLWWWWGALSDTEGAWWPAPAA